MNVRIGKLIFTKPAILRICFALFVVGGTIAAGIRLQDRENHMAPFLPIVSCIFVLWFLFRNLRRYIRRAKE